MLHKLHRPVLQHQMNTPCSAHTATHTHSPTEALLSYKNCWCACAQRTGAAARSSKIDLAGSRRPRVIIAVAQALFFSALLLQQQIIFDSQLLAEALYLFFIKFALEFMRSKAWRCCARESPLTRSPMWAYVARAPSSAAPVV